MFLQKYFCSIRQKKEALPITRRWDWFSSTVSGFQTRWASAWRGNLMFYAIDKWILEEHTSCWLREDNGVNSLYSTTQSGGIYLFRKPGFIYIWQREKSIRGSCFLRLFWIEYSALFHMWTSTTEMVINFAYFAWRCLEWAKKSFGVSWTGQGKEIAISH